MRLAAERYKPRVRSWDDMMTRAVVTFIDGHVDTYDLGDFATSAEDIQLGPETTWITLEGGLQTRLVILRADQIASISFEAID